MEVQEVLGIKKAGEILARDPKGRQIGQVFAKSPKDLKAPDQIDETDQKKG